MKAPKMIQTPEITAKSWIMVAVLGLTWGATFMVTEMALEGISPFWLASGRQVIGAVAMVGLWAALKRPPVPAQGARWPYLMVAGVTSSALPFILLAWGQQYTTSGFAGVSMAAVVLIIVPLAHVFLPGERMTWRRTIGFLVGFVGVVVLIGGGAFDRNGAQLETYGRLACLGAATCYAVSSIILRKCPPIDAVAMATVLILIGATISIPVAWLAEGPPMMPPRGALTALIVLGLVPTAGANVLRVMVIRTAGPVFMSLVNYQVPVWSVILGALVLGEAVPASLGLAMGLIMLGVALSQWGALRRLFAR